MEELKLQNRRTFVKNSLLAGISIPFIQNKSIFKNNNRIKITILHTNDMHSHIDPFSINSKHSGMGGMTRVSSLVKEIRKIETNVLLLDAGDIFQGTPYFNRYKGKLELQIMSEMGYCASTMGNHDFDNGLDGFLNVLPNANFPFLCANYDFSNTILKNKTKPYQIVEIDNVKIGIIGIGIKLEGLVDENLFQKTIYLDPVDKANQWAKHLKHEEQCNFIICLSHLGYEYNNDKISDIKLAKQSRNIDLIIGGHTHTFLDNAKEIKNISGKDVLINQAGWGALSLGRIDLFFDKTSNQNNNLAITKLPKKNYAKI